MRKTIKLITTCLSFILFGFMTLKAQNNNNLVVFSENGDRFYLILNGLKYNQEPQTNVKVTNLNANTYKAKIIFEKPFGDLNSNIYLMWEGADVTGKEFTYAVHKKGDKYKLKFISQADMGGVNANASNSVVYYANGTPANTNVVTTTTDVNTNVNSNSNTVSTGVTGSGNNSSTTVTTTTSTGTNGQNGNVGMNVNVDGLNMSINVNGTGTGTGVNSNSNTTTTSTTTTYTSSSTSYNSGGATQSNPANTGPVVTSSGGCSNAMSQSNFDDLVKSIGAKSFEEAKMKVAKQGVSANCVNTGQVRKLMDLFSFEDSKLDLTKYAYDYTTDKNNYFKVNDGFTFDSSVDTLNDYISKKK